MPRLALVAALLLPPLAAVAGETAAPAAPAAPVAPVAPAPAELKGTVGAGLIVLTGNSDTTTFTGAASASRETFGWIVAAKAAGAYGQTRPAAGGARQTTAYAMSGQLRLDRKFGGGWAVFVLGGLEADHVANVAYRTIAELGVAAQWLDVKEADLTRVALRTDLGLRYGYEARWRYYGTPTGAQPGVEVVAPLLGLAFRWGFSREVFFTEEAEVFPSLGGEPRVQARSVAKLSSRLTQALTLGVGYTASFDSRPAAGKERTDTALTALLEVGF